jgi:hypothetical protein
MPADIPASCRGLDCWDRVESGHAYCAEHANEFVDTLLDDVDRRGAALATLCAERDAAVRERDEARDERDVFQGECASISEELGLPPTMRPVEGYLRRMVQAGRDARDALATERTAHDETRELLRKVAADRDAAVRAVSDGVGVKGVRASDPRVRRLPAHYVERRWSHS